MKRSEILRYQLADIGPESPMMTVHLRRTPAGYWQFRLEHNLKSTSRTGCSNLLPNTPGLKIG